MIRSADTRMLQPRGYTGWPTYPISGTKDRWNINISAVSSKQVPSGIQNQTPRTGFADDLKSVFSNRLPSMENQIPANPFPTESRIDELLHPDSKCRTQQNRQQATLETRTAKYTIHFSNPYLEVIDFSQL